MPEAPARFAERLVRSLPRTLRDPAIDRANAYRLARARAARAPRWITLFVTNYCNARCEHCFYWSELNRRTPELSAQDIARLFRSLDQPVNTVRLSGGEPFLRKDLEDIVRAADATGRIRKLSIPTHGMFRGLADRVERMAASLRSTHLNVSVSLDGLRRRHDANRKIRNGFDLAIANLRRLRELDDRAPHFNVSVSVSLTRAIATAPDGGRPEAIELIAFLRDEVGIRDIGCDHVRSADTDVFGVPPAMRTHFTTPPLARDDPDLWNRREDAVQLAVDEMAAVNRMLEPWLTGRAGRLTLMRLDKQVEILRTRRRLVDCLAGTVDCVIYPSGEVAVCEFTRPFGNLHDTGMDLMRLMRGAAAEAARAATRSCACSHPCHLSDSLAYDAGFLKRFLSD